MESSKQLATRFTDLFLDGKWIANTNYKELLSDVSWEQATTKINSLNTIALLTFHINYYVAGVLHVFNGGNLEIRDKYSFDIKKKFSADDWHRLYSDLVSNAEKFAHKIEQMSDEKLDAPFVKEAYGSYRRNIEGMIEHSYYHLGQLSLLKKMVLVG